MAKHRRKYPVCTNCNFVFEKEQPDNFCPRCGQENHDLNVPFKHVALELLEGTIHYDSKFWTTVKYLLFYPGRLTNEFHRGRRVGYVPPIRLYVFISFVFFLLLSLRVSSIKEGEKSFAIDVRAAEAAASEKPENLAVPGPASEPNPKANNQYKTYPNPSDTSKANLTTSDILVDLPQHATQAQLDSALGKFGVDDPNWLYRGSLQKVANLQKLPKNEVLLKALKYLSVMMFVLMPVFALLLKLVFYRARRYYMEHLMFSIHLHCFFFLLYTLYMLLLYVFSPGGLFGWFNLLGILYLYLGLKRVFKRSYIRTFFNMLMVLLLYTVAGVATLLLGLIVSVAI
ncbi:DUF3667 domain-containing protein [Rufibacter roseus]|uniref:DUF3667 domain-containing protein n=1 Tax=Rufibacter roseus TaxID=1567108 RepID=A0ABW2DFB1_9BACT|nr:DUF3667 domain-containing protein [Rufibacter roseus]